MTLNDFYKCSVHADCVNIPGKYPLTKSTKSGYGPKLFCNFKKVHTNVNVTLDIMVMVLLVE